jgi:hypothetical protein
LSDLGLDFGGFERGEDVVGELGPDEGLWVGVDGVDVDVGWDGGFEVGRGAMDTTPGLLSVRLAKKRSTWLIQEADVGVKCTFQRGRLANQLRIG